MRQARRNIGRLILTVTLSALLPGLTSCATKIWPFSDDETPAADESKGTEPVAVKTTTKSKISGPKPSSSGDLELKQAQLWNRLEDLEEQVRVQKEQIKLLEQGLLTGIPPEAIRKGPRTKINTKPLDADESATKSARFDHAALPPAPVLDLPDDLTPNANSSSASSPDSYKVKIQVAKDYYQSSRFGLAIAELAQIMRHFGAKAGDGEARYYLGRSYLGLKEYVTARDELDSFLKEFPASSLRGMARLELARAYAGLNLRERSRKELATVARDFEGQDEGDIAVGELKTMKGNL